jgi:transglutaminase-like putative cysteine protease
MKLCIKKETSYTYARPVSFGPHHVRVFPRADLSVNVGKIGFSTGAGGDVQFRQDLFDNHIAYCFYPNPSASLPFRLEMEIEVREKNPFHFLLDPGGLQIPPAYKPQALEILQPYLSPAGDCKLPEPLAPTVPRPTVETLVNFNHWLHENLDYIPREEGEPYTPAETLAKGSGSCRDFAVLLAEALRRNGVAARLASGFVWEGDKPKNEKRSTGAMHLWVEACLPGAGWIGLDPTNGVLTDHHFITTAVGRFHADVAPVSGAYYSDDPVESEMSSEVSVAKIP